MCISKARDVTLEETRLPPVKAKGPRPVPRPLLFQLRVESEVNTWLPETDSPQGAVPGRHTGPGDLPWPGVLGDARSEPPPFHLDGPKIWKKLGIKSRNWKKVTFCLLDAKAECVKQRDVIGDVAVALMWWANGFPTLRDLAWILVPEPRGDAHSSKLGAWCRGKHDPHKPPTGVNELETRKRGGRDVISAKFESPPSDRVRGLDGVTCDIEVPGVLYGVTPMVQVQYGRETAGSGGGSQPRQAIVLGGARVSRVAADEVLHPEPCGVERYVGIGDRAATQWPDDRMAIKNNSRSGEGALSPIPPFEVDHEVEVLQIRSR